MNLRPPALFWMTTALVLAGCKREDSIVTYDAPKPPADVPATQPIVAVSESALPGPRIEGMTYTAPADWAPEKPHQFELARFAAAKGGAAFATVSQMGPQFDPAPNVARWQGQVGLTPSAPDAVPGLLADTTVGGQSAKSVDLKGKEQRVVVTYVQQPSGTLIYKLTGPVDAVEAAKPAYDAFLKSIRFGDAAAPPPAVATPAPAPAAESGVPFTFTVPAEWTADPKPHAMRAMTWSVGGAEIFIASPINASAFELPSNLNRWRGQIGLPPIAGPDDLKTTEVKIGDQSGTLVDLSSPAQNKRLIVAYAGKDQYWFFKMQGPADAVAAQKPAFDKFLASVKFR